MFRNRAKPGPWYSSYIRDWGTAHPGAVRRRELDPGGFYRGNVWASSTLDWDKEWLRAHGMAMPRKSRHREADKNVVVLAERLDSGESVHIEIERREDRE
jgi:hypothetical protein